MKYLCTKFKHFQDMNAKILNCQWKNETKLDKWSWRLYLWIWRLCCCCSVTKLCPTLCDPMGCSMPGFPVLHHLLEFGETHVHWVSDVIQPSHPLLSTSHPAFNLYQHQGLSNESALCIRWPKYWSFSFNISPSNEYSGLISFRMDWLDLLAVQGTLKSLLQHHSSKASILLCSAFSLVQLSDPYMTIGKTIALTIWTFVGKIMTLVFNMLSRFVIAYFPRSKQIWKTQHWRIDAFELRCWRRLLRVPWTARRSNQSIVEEISLEYSWEGLMLKLKLQ